MRKIPTACGVFVTNFLMTTLANGELLDTQQGSLTLVSNDVEEIVVFEKQSTSSVTIETEKLVKMPGTMGDPIMYVAPPPVTTVLSSTIFLPVIYSMILATASLMKT